MKKRIAVSLTALIISIIVASLTEARPNAAFMNTIYTVAGIMFSIGMGVICAFNPSKIQNRNYLTSIKNNITSVRNIFIKHFFFISIGYLIYQIYPSANYSINYKFLRIDFSLSLVLSAFIITSIVYFIVNFIEIQKLNFDISERINGSS